MSIFRRTIPDAINRIFRRTIPDVVHLHWYENPLPIENLQDIFHFKKNISKKLAKRDKASSPRFRNITNLFQTKKHKGFKFRIYTDDEKLIFKPADKLFGEMGISGTAKEILERSGVTVHEIESTYDRLIRKNARKIPLRDDLIRAKAVQASEGHGSLRNFATRSDVNRFITPDQDVPGWHLDWDLLRHVKSFPKKQTKPCFFRLPNTPTISLLAPIWKPLREQVDIDSNVKVCSIQKDPDNEKQFILHYDAYKPNVVVPLLKIKKESLALKEFRYLNPHSDVISIQADSINPKEQALRAFIASRYSENELENFQSKAFTIREWNDKNIIVDRQGEKDRLIIPYDKMPKTVQEIITERLQFSFSRQESEKIKKRGCESNDPFGSRFFVSDAEGNPLLTESGQQLSFGQEYKNLHAHVSRAFKNEAKKETRIWEPSDEESAKILRQDLNEYFSNQTDFITVCFGIPKRSSLHRFWRRAPVKYEQHAKRDPENYRPLREDEEPPSVRITKAGLSGGLFLRYDSKRAYKHETLDELARDGDNCEEVTRLNQTLDLADGCGVGVLDTPSSFGLLEKGLWFIEKILKNKAAMENERDILYYPFEEYFDVDANDISSSKWAVMPKHMRLSAAIYGHTFRKSSFDRTCSYGDPSSQDFIGVEQREKNAKDLSLAMHRSFVRKLKFMHDAYGFLPSVLVPLTESDMAPLREELHSEQVIAALREPAAGIDKFILSPDPGKHDFLSIGRPLGIRRLWSPSPQNENEVKIATHLKELLRSKHGQPRTTYEDFKNAKQHMFEISMRGLKEISEGDLRDKGSIYLARTISFTHDLAVSGDDYDYLSTSILGKYMPQGKLNNAGIEGLIHASPFDDTPRGSTSVISGIR